MRDAAATRWEPSPRCGGSRDAASDADAAVAEPVLRRPVVGMAVEIRAPPAVAAMQRQHSRVERLLASWAPPPPPDSRPAGRPTGRQAGALGNSII